jgi:UDP-N-acetylmuramyl tripeptide synthase
MHQAPVPPRPPVAAPTLFPSSRLRRTGAIAAASAASVAVRLVRHHGTSLPGMLANRIDPLLVRDLASQLGHVILVVGTNGKTTTARLTARIIAKAAGKPPVANRSGANLRQGIASSLVAEANLLGRLRHPGGSAVLEVDELAFGGLVDTVTPSVVVLLNLFRDQLDRYGEVDAIVDVWRAALDRLPSGTVLVSCADDPRVENLVAASGHRIVRFGLAGPVREGTAVVPHHAPASPEAGPTAADPVACPVCGTSLECSWVSLGHLGAWACPAGHVRRAAPDVSVRIVDADRDGSSRIEFAGRFGSEHLRIRLAGITAAYDAAAAVAAATVTGIGPLDAIRALDGATPAFGRFEEARFRGRRIVLALAKNPASLTESARVAASLRPDGVLVGLSDEPADGRDVSWIWDVDFEVLRGIPALGVTGSRGNDLALRLKYASGELGARWPIVVRTAVAERAIQRMLSAIRPGGTLVVLATYTSLLAMRAALQRHGAVSAMPR